MAFPGELLRRAEMTLVERVLRHCRAAARILAIVAAFLLAFGVHPPHSEATTPDSHQTGHHGSGIAALFGSSCLQEELAGSGTATPGPGTVGHADCTQIFDPLQRPPLAGAPDYLFTISMTPHDLPFRQVATSFDPPPPRHG